MRTVDEFDLLAAADSPLHAIDPRAKLLVVLLAAAVIASYPRHAVAAMVPLFLLPAAWLALGRVPLGFVLHRLLPALPFVLLMAIFNPLIDRVPLIEAGGLALSGGWISFASILLRFLLGMSIAILLVACTGFNTLCSALLRLHAPRVFVVQLLLLYRYIFLLADEARRVRLAYALRSGGDRAVALPVAGSMLGQLLLRVMSRGQRIHQAMLGRGFTGDLPVRHAFRWHGRDTLFLLGWAVWIILARAVNIPDQLGRFVMKVLA